VEELQKVLETVKANSASEIQKVRREYELKLTKLRMSLEKEKKQSTKLNEMINCLKEELRAKEIFINAPKK
jgi:hypothetical protein